MYFPVFGGLFRQKVGEVKAVDNISFTVREGETLGIVGESGCGKSTAGKCLLKLYELTCGDILFRSRLRNPPRNSWMSTSFAGRMVNIAKLNHSQMKPFRAEIQMIFQDPFSSLNPRMTVKDIIIEPIKIHQGQLSKKEMNQRVLDLMEKIGLSAEQATRYPHEFSGGERQRIGIARALASYPRLIIADEPVSALDVSIQAQVINLMQDLQEQMGLTYIFIAHNLAVVEHIADRIAVMYLGNLVEIADTDTLFNMATHPYTKALLSAIPLPDPNIKSRERIILAGDIPTSLDKPFGCGFKTRCPIARDQCSTFIPELTEISSGHFVACPYISSAC